MKTCIRSPPVPITLPSPKALSIRAGKKNNSFQQHFHSNQNISIMAHHLHFDQQSNRYAFFSVKEKAWHGLGQIVTAYPTSKEAMAFAGLDYLVEKRPLSTIAVISSDAAHPSSGISVPDYFATVRNDTQTVLGVVGKDYQIIQNQDAFSFFDSIVGGTEGILYETAGALGKGERIFITAKLPDYIRVGNGEDITEKYLFFTNSHDGSGSITAAFTPVRVCCQNTLNAALKNCSNVIRIRHTASAKQRLDNAHRVMGISSQFSQQLETVFNQWAKTRITDPQLKQLIQMALAPNKEMLDKLDRGVEDEFSARFQNQCDQAFEYALSAESQNMPTTAGTVFGGYNAITGFFQNVQGYKTQEDKVKSILYGGTAQLKGQRAFNLCHSFAKSGQFSLN